MVNRLRSRLRVMPFGAPVAWTPAALFASSEKGAWFDPSDFSTLFQDSAGTTPVTAVGQPVGRVLDKSGRGNHATQATATARPVLQQDAGGGYYLSLDGVDDWIVTPSVNFTTTDKMTVFLGVQKNVDTTGMMVELSAVRNSNNGSFSVFTDAHFNAICRGTADSGRRTSGGTSGVNTSVVSVSFDLAGASQDAVTDIRRNGAADEVALSGTTPGGGNFGNYPIYIGLRGGTTIPFNGRIYGLIVRGAATDLTAIKQTEAWLNARTGAF